jgi:hypothetical protein
MKLLGSTVRPGYSWANRALAGTLDSFGGDHRVQVFRTEVAEGSLRVALILGMKAALSLAFLDSG